MTLIRSSVSSGKKIQAVVLENLRRFWPMSLVAFLILFVSTTLPAMITEKSDAVESFLVFTMKSTHPAFVIISFLLPIIATITVFRHLHNSGVATVTHALPMTRRELYIGSVVSAFILSFGAILLAAISVLPLISWSVSKLSLEFLENNEAANFTLWFVWIAALFVIVLFVLAVSTFSSILSGSAAVNVLLAIIINFILLMMYSLIVGYLSTFLLGFEVGADAGSIAVHMHPIPLSMMSGGLPIISALVFIAVSCALLRVSMALYKHKKIERTGDAITFISAEYVVLYIISLLGTAVSGVMFHGVFDNAKTAFFAGIVIGAIIVFLVVSMILQGTPKVFNVKTLKKFGVFVIICAVFISCTVFDITGYANRIPDPESISSAEFTIHSYPFNIPYADQYFISRINIDVTSEEDLNILTDLHRQIISVANGETYFTSGDYTVFTYNTDSPFKLHRSYGSYSDTDFSSLAEMQSFRYATSLDSFVGYENIKNIDLFDSYKETYELLLSKTERMELAKCLDKDYRALDLAEMSMEPVPEQNDYDDYIPEYGGNDDNIICNFVISYSADSNYIGSYVESLRYTVTSDYPNTIQWLKKNDLYETVRSLSYDFNYYYR